MESKEALQVFEINQHKEGQSATSFKVDKEIVVSDGLFRFLQSLGNDLYYTDAAEFVAFVMEDYARLLLTENKKRLGELMADAEISAHVVQTWELCDD